jgi:hypothetical protein
MRQLHARSTRLQFEPRELARTHADSQRTHAALNALRTRERTWLDGQLRCSLDAVRSNPELEAADVPRIVGRVYDSENRCVGGERLHHTEADDFGEDDLPDNTQKRGRYTTSLGGQGKWERGVGAGSGSGRGRGG